MIDKGFIYRKIDLIEQDLQHLSKLKGMTFNEVAQDFSKFSTLKLVMKVI